MDFAPYIRKPFKIQALRVTTDNVAELSELVGDGRVRTKDNGTRFFSSDPQMIRNIARVEVGYWVTKMDDQYRVYKPDVFSNIFVELTQERDAILEVLQDLEDREVMVERDGLDDGSISTIT